MDTNILLENGTNELEVLEFVIGNNHYGINVAKVKEIIKYCNVTAVPNSHKCVEGIIMPREKIITVVNLAEVTQSKFPEDNSNDMLIITNFNKLNIAFHVERICGIHRVSWTDITVPDSSVTSGTDDITTGVVKINGTLIVILDFEHIINDISPETGLKVSDVERFADRERNDIPIYLAEDSALLMQLISDSLIKSGYTNINKSVNGQECWDKLCELADKYGDDVVKEVGLVITDIEMPQMDGHRLTRLIKEDSKLKSIPVVIFSSLINDDMRRKGEAIGADAQLSKPEIGQLVEQLDKLLMK